MISLQVRLRDMVMYSVGQRAEVPHLVSVTKCQWSILAGACVVQSTRYLLQHHYSGPVLLTFVNDLINKNSRRTISSTKFSDKVIKYTYQWHCC